MDDTGICRECGVEKQKTEFYMNGRYIRKICKICDNKKTVRRLVEKGRSDKVFAKQRNQRSAAYAKRERALGLKRGKYIVQDSRQEDRKHGRANDLDREFTDQLISKGCAYCLETTLKISLDRIDNSLGHLKSNVKAACLRCNYMRRNMPYSAWERLVPIVRQLREENLFGNWMGGGPAEMAEAGRNRNAISLDKASAIRIL